MDSKAVSYQIQPHLAKANERTSSQLLLLGMGTFLCITSCLALLVELCNFSLTYQVQGIVFELLDKENSVRPFPVDGIVLPKSTYSDTSRVTASVSTSGFTNDMTETSSSTSSGSSTTKVLSTTQMTTFPKETVTSPHYDKTSTGPLSTTLGSISESTETATLQNPIQILNELHKMNKMYACANLCSSVIQAQLNLTLSVIGDNYMLITSSVATNDEKSAKRKIAYLALNFLYKDDVKNSKVDDDWSKPIPSDCAPNGTLAWGKCS